MQPHIQHGGKMAEYRSWFCVHKMCLGFRNSNRSSKYSTSRILASNENHLTISLKPLGKTI